MSVLQLLSVIFLFISFHEHEEIRNHPGNTLLQKILPEKLWSKSKTWYLSNYWKDVPFWIKNFAVWLEDGEKFHKANMMLIANVAILGWWGLLSFALIGFIHSCLDGSIKW